MQVGKTIKKLLKYAGRIVAALLLLVVLLVVAVYLPPVQNWLVKRAAAIASEQTGMEISVGHVCLKFPLDVALDDVRVVQQRDTIADIGRVVADVKLWPLFSNKVVVDDLELQRAKINTLDMISDLQVQGQIGRLGLSVPGIHLDSGTVALSHIQLAEADLLVQLSDTAAVDTTTSETPWSIVFDDIHIDRSRLRLYTPGDSLHLAATIGSAHLNGGDIDLLHSRYAIESFDWHDGELVYDQMFEPKADSGLDFNHLALTKINIGLDSLLYADPLLRVNVREGSLNEASGLEVKKLVAGIRMDDQALHVSDLNLETPHSAIAVNADIDFSVTDEVQPGQLVASIDASIGRSDLALLLSDLPSLWPDEPLTVRGAAKGNMQRATIGALVVELPTAFKAEVSGTAEHLDDTKRLLAQLDMNVQTQNTRFLDLGVSIPSGMTLGGSLKANNRQYTAHLLGALGKGRVQMDGTFNERTMSYDGQLKTKDFDLRQLLPDESLRRLTADIALKGQGTDFLQPSTWVDADAVVERLEYADMMLDSLTATANLHDGHALISFNSRNEKADAHIDIDALLSPDHVQAVIHPNINVLDLHALQMSDAPLVVGFCGQMDLESDLDQTHQLTGMLGEFFLQDSVATYRPEDLGLHVVTRPDTTYASMQSGDLKVRFNASGGYQLLAEQFSALADTINVQLQRRTIDQPLIKQILPTMQLYVESGTENPLAKIMKNAVSTSFNELHIDLHSSPVTGLNGDAHLYGLNADSTRIDTVSFHLRHSEGGLSYQAEIANNRRNPQFVFRALADGKIYDQGASLGVRYYDADGQMGARIGAMIKAEAEGLRFHLIPERPLLGYKEFSLNSDNFLFIGHDLKLQAQVDLIADDGTGVKVTTEEQDSTMLQDLTISLFNFDLESVTSVMPYMPRIAGTLNGDYHLVMNQQEQISIASDMQVQQLSYEGSPMGNISTEFVYLQRENETHALEGILYLDKKEIGGLRGQYRDQGDGYLEATLKLTHLPLSILNGFVASDQLLGFEGYTDGRMSVEGSLRYPKAEGAIYMDSVYLVSQPYGIKLRFKEDSVRVVNSKLLFEDFALYADNRNALTVNGNVDFHDTNRMTMDMRIVARNFQLINAKQTTKSIAYGKMFVNFFAMLNGPTERLKMRGKLDVLGTTDLTYIMLDSPLSTDNQLDELVKFTDFNDTTQTVVERPEPSGLEMDMSISIDQGAHVRCDLNADQSNYIELQGGGDLRMRYNSSDGLNLTGRYTFANGEMKYSLPIIPLKTFTIQDGSYVEFTGDAANPTLNLTATERRKATVGGDEGQSRSVTFDCGVVITKTLNDMGLQFIISAPEDMNVANDLASMSVEERGKLAVTMLTTGMYLADGNTGSFSMNSALSSFLQSEINNITGNALKTLDLSVGLDNTTDASGAMHTDYSFKFAKRFWNNRLSVQIGGKVSTGSEAQQGQNQSFFDNVTMEYRLSPTSNQYVKLFYNQNAYDWLEGYTGEYGGGYIWKRKLDSFWDIFRGTRKEERGVRSDGRGTRSEERGARNEKTDTLKTTTRP